MHDCKGATRNCFARDLDLQGVTRGNSIQIWDTTPFRCRYSQVPLGRTKQAAHGPPSYEQAQTIHIRNILSFLYCTVLLRRCVRSSHCARTQSAPMYLSCTAKIRSCTSICVSPLRPVISAGRSTAMYIITYIYDVALLLASCTSTSTSSTFPFKDSYI